MQDRKGLDEGQECQQPSDTVTGEDLARHDLEDMKAARRGAFLGGITGNPIVGMLLVVPSAARMVKRQSIASRKYGKCEPQQFASEADRTAYDVRHIRPLYLTYTTTALLMIVAPFLAVSAIVILAWNGIPLLEGGNAFSQAAERYVGSIRSINACLRLLESRQAIDDFDARVITNIVAVTATFGLSVGIFPIVFQKYVAYRRYIHELRKSYIEKKAFDNIKPVVVCGGLFFMSILVYYLVMVSLTPIKFCIRSFSSGLNLSGAIIFGYVVFSLSSIVSVTIAAVVMEFIFQRRYCEGGVLKIDRDVDRKLKAITGSEAN